MQGSSRPDRELLDAAALCRHLVPEGSVHAFLAEHRGRLFPDEMFADLFPSGRGRPSVPADVVATTMVLQALEGLSDRDAVRQLATNIAWKAAAGLALTDEAFHPTVLTLWRNRLRASDDWERIFNAVPAVITECGVLTGKTRRAIDSTVLDDAVARQGTVSLLVTQIRRVRRLVPGLRGVWVREHNLDGGRPPCDWDDPADIDRLVSELVDDANELVWAADDLDLDETQADAVALLALSLARTWNRATGRASGGSPSAPPRTRSFQPWTPRPATPTRPSTPTGTATKPMSPASPTPASSPATTSPPATAATPKPPPGFSTASPRAPRSWAIPPMAPATCGRICTTRR